MVRSSSNPFTPTFGSMPHCLAGRDELIGGAVEGLANRPGDPNRSTIFIGPHGSGKTVLLRTIEQVAREQGWVGVNVIARMGMLERVVTLGREAAAHLVKTAESPTKTSLKLGPVAVGREPHKTDEPLWLSVRHLVEDLNAQGVGFMVTVDEVDPDCEELIEYISSYQELISEGRDVALLMAGLPSKVSALLTDEHVSFIRRAFQRVLQPIDQVEVEEALQETIETGGKAIEYDALKLAASSTRGYAFAIQLVGYNLWREGRAADVITFEQAQRAIERSERELEYSIFIPTLREPSEREQEYLVAMAQDEGPSRRSGVARRMGISMTNASNLRRRLIERGVIGEVRLGVVDFDMPMLKGYLREHEGEIRLSYY